MNRIFTICLLLGLYSFALKGNAVHLSECCAVPHDKTILCTDLPYSFEASSRYQLQTLFGTPKSVPTCRFLRWNELEPIVSLNSCRIGTIRRQFEIFPTDPWKPPFLCEQVITINGDHEYKIKFPADAEGNCSVPQADEVEVFEINCDLLAVSVNEERFEASGDECYKVFRTFRVINWCEFDEESSRPIVIGRDEDCDGKAGDEAVWVTRKSNGDVFIDRDNNEYNANPALAELKPSCGHDGVEGYWRSFSVAPEAPLHPKTGFWQYTQIIKVYDAITPEITPGLYENFCSLTDAACEGRVTIPLSINENCTPNDLSFEVYLYQNGIGVPRTPANNIAGQVLTGTYPNYTITGIYPIGAHSFVVNVSDGCGNSNFVEFPFQVRDCKAPAPICLESVSAATMPVYDDNGTLIDAMAVVWASDFVRSDTEERCSLPVTYSVHKQSDIDEGLIEPSPDSTSISVSCADAQTIPVYVYAWDASGLGDACSSQIIVNDQFNICGNGANPVVSGQIQTQFGQSVNNVTVELTGMNEGLTLTSSDGVYIFNELNNGMDYTITPKKNDDVINGVNTMDLIYIQRHILDVDRLDSPYFIIAADANQSGRVTALDLIQIRKVILSIESEFKDSDSWRFIDKHFEFEDPNNPFKTDFPEFVTLSGIDSNILNMDFVAVKVGDATGDVQINGIAATPQVRSNNAVTITSTQKTLPATQLPIYLNSDQPIAGVQFTMQIDLPEGATVSVQYDGMASADHLYLVEDQPGILTFSWNQATALSAEAIKLFTLEFSQPIASSALDISNRLTPSLAFDDQGHTFPVRWERQSMLAEAQDFRVLPNTPNPFTDETLLQFYLPKAATTTIRIIDVTGKIWQQQHLELDAGWQQHTLDGRQLHNGLWLYQIQQGAHIVTKKMLVQ